MILEICAGSLTDCKIAEQSGANRIELNSALEIGGLTPSHGLLMEAKKHISLPIIVMIRPRGGGFCYTDDEFATMLTDIEFCIDNNFQGIAIGLLNNDGSLNYKQMKIVSKYKDNIELVFHRAFDVMQNPFEAITKIAEFGFSRILSSGLKTSAYKGISNLKKMVELADNKIDILPGCGINLDNFQKIIAETNCNQIHGSFSTFFTDLSSTNKHGINFYPQNIIDETKIRIADKEKILRIVKN